MLSVNMQINKHFRQSVIRTTMAGPQARRVLCRRAGYDARRTSLSVVLPTPECWRGSRPVRLPVQARPTRYVGRERVSDLQRYREARRAGSWRGKRAACAAVLTESRSKVRTDPMALPRFSTELCSSAAMMWVTFGEGWRPNSPSRAVLELPVLLWPVLPVAINNGAVVL